MAMGLLGGGAAAVAEPVPTPNPLLPPISNGLPTVPPALPTYVVNGDGTRTLCVAIDQALSCDWR
jgi:hypothetical protein